MGGSHYSEQWGIPIEPPSCPSLWIDCLEDSHETLHDPRPSTLDHRRAVVGELVGGQQPRNAQGPGIIEVGAVPAESQKGVPLFCQPEDVEVSHDLPSITLQRKNSQVGQHIINILYTSKEYSIHVQTRLKIAVLELTLPNADNCNCSQTLTLFAITYYDTV